MAQQRNFLIAGTLVAASLATNVAALTCIYSKSNGSAVFTFDGDAGAVEIRLGEALIAQLDLQCGPMACTYSQDLGNSGGRLHHTMQHFPERSEVIYAVLHEDFSARSIIQIYPVDCTAP